MADLQQAISLLGQDGALCVVCKNGITTTDCRRGILPLVVAASEKTLSGAAVADKIIGSAAALLLLYGGVCEAYGQVMSRNALTLLQNGGINAQYGCLTDSIQNRAGDGLCPMEQAVSGVDNPCEAYEILKKKVVGE